MTWVSKAKNLSITNTVPHPPRAAGVGGSPPGIASIGFSPLGLYGAAARCSHLHVISPSAVTAESLMMKALIETHVDDVYGDFAVLASADNFKDFVKGYFAGTVAAGIAYLALIADGYVWSDHFENIKGGKPGAAATPDFVFAKSSNVALVESKGTRSDTLGGFDTTVRDGYDRQVEPHLGWAVGGTTATCGMSVGSWMTSTKKAELRIHHTDVVAVSGGAGLGSAGAAAGASPPGGDSASLAVIQQHNYATAFTLCHSVELGQQVRSGDLPSSIEFERFRWRGKWWLTSASSLAARGVNGADGRDALVASGAPAAGFVIEETVALNVLISIAARRGGAPVTLGLDRQLQVDPFAGGIEDDEEAGVIFPDGLAVLSEEAINGKTAPFSLIELDDLWTRLRAETEIEQERPAETNKFVQREN